MALAVPGRAVISVGGPQLVKFLQSLCTSDVAAWMGSSDVGLQPTAFLTTKGRVLADGILHKASEEEVFLDVAAAQSAALMKHMKTYKLRSKVTIGAREDLWVAAKEGEADPRYAALGPRSIVDAVSGEVAGYTRYRLAAGVGEAGEIANGIPLQCNLDMLGHISFSKGCYLGQELTARAFHRGTVRKRLLPVVLADPTGAAVSRTSADDLLAGRLPENTSLPSSGKLKALETGDDVADLVAVDGPVGLALFKLDFALGDRPVDAVTADGLHVRPFLPAWWPDDHMAPPSS